MKKLFLVIFISLTFNVMSQGTDSFLFNDWQNTENRDEDYPGFPDYHGSINNDGTAPLGSGIMILTTIGVGYAIIKRKEVEKQ